MLECTHMTPETVKARDSLTHNKLSQTDISKSYQSELGSMEYYMTINSKQAAAITHCRRRTESLDVLSSARLLHQYAVIIRTLRCYKCQA